MKKLVLIFFIITAPTFAQFELSASMGIHFINSPSLYDYLNQNYASPGETIEGFNSAINFSGEAGYNLSSSFQSAIDIGYNIYSYTSSGSLGQYDLTYGNLLLSLLGYYVLTGEGYNFKFGGGGGVRFLSADESLPGTGITKTFSSTGFGLLLRAEGNTLLGGNIYAKIGAQVGYDFNGEPENNGNPIPNNASNENVNFNSLSIGVSLGVSYIF